VNEDGVTVVIVTHEFASPPEPDDPAATASWSNAGYDRAR
jgi:hypothetical protein